MRRVEEVESLGGYYTVTAICRKLRLTRRQVHYLIQRDAIPIWRIANVHLVSLATVKEARKRTKK